MKHLVLLLIFVGVSATLNSQHVIKIDTHATPFIEGSTKPGEWNATDSVKIQTNTAMQEVQIRFQRNDTSLFFIFMGNLAIFPDNNFPEILLDMNYSRSTTWEGDDHWFHVSATDCHFQGNHSDYSDCAREQPDWWARRNWAMSAPDPDTVEIEIPFQKIGLDLSTTDTIGIAFDVTNTFNRWHFWPSTADIDNPSTWGKAYFKDAQPSSVVEQLHRPEIALYPNPCVDYITWTDAAEEWSAFKVFNLQGMLLKEGELQGRQHKVEMISLQSGTYLLELTNHNAMTYRYPVARQ